MLVKPWRQGDFDSLCGLYALVNAVRLLHPSLPKEAAEDLFDHLVDELLHGHSLPGSFVRHGIPATLVVKLGRSCCEFAHDVLELSLALARFPVLRHVSLAAIWNGIRAGLDHGSAIVICVEGGLQHCTVVQRATDKVLHLLDSDGVDELPREMCTVAQTRDRYRLVPSGIFLMCRQDGGDCGRGSARSHWRRPASATS